MNKGKIYFGEFKDVFHNPDIHLQDDGIDLLYEFTSDLLQMSEDDRIKTLKGFKSEVHDYRQNNDRCPKCNEDLIIISKKDNEKLEYFGTLCRQTIHIKKCPYCGWKEDD